jgi:hypothetical protein
MYTRPMSDSCLIDTPRLIEAGASVEHTFYAHAVPAPLLDLVKIPLVRVVGVGRFFCRPALHRVRANPERDANKLHQFSTDRAVIFSFRSVMKRIETLQAFAENGLFVADLTGAAAQD